MSVPVPQDSTRFDSDPDSVEPGDPAAGSHLRVEIVTPDQPVWVGRATSVSLPSVGGRVGVLPRRQPLAAELVAGTVTVRAVAGGEVVVLIGGGFVTVDGDDVVVLADPPSGDWSTTA